MNSELCNLIKEYVDNNSELLNPDANNDNLEIIQKIINLLLSSPDNIALNIQSSLKNCDTDYTFDIKWLSGFPSSTKQVGYILSFKEAGDILVDNSKGLRADYMFISVMFNYMQYVELVLKNIISSANINPKFTHDLDELWKEAKTHLKNSLPSIAINILESIITSVFSPYNSSMAFRYREDKNQKDYVENEFSKDLYVMKIWIEVFDNIIYETYS